jgi:hypothetical protein
MKWIGQHIYDLIARFRNDVYLESLSTTTETNVLVVDSSGKISKSTTLADDIIESEIDTLAGLTSFGSAGATTNILAGDLAMYNAVNDGNPTISIGSTVTNRAQITAVYNSGTQTFDRLNLTTYTTSSTTDDGRISFQIDEVQKGDFNDAGLTINESCDLEMGQGIPVLSDSSGTCTLKNIDALDATTEATIKTALFDSGIVINPDDKNITPALDGLTLHIDTNTYTDNNTSEGGTSAADFATVSIEGSSLAAPHASTTTNAATLYIKDAITAETNKTITNSYALWVDSGNVRLDGTGNTIGTVTSGTWQGTAIASAYLDADTAHLSGTQSFTGAKSFQDNVVIFDGDRSVTPGDGAVIHVDAHTVTDGNTSGSGTAAKYTHVNIEAPRLAATNSSVTTTAAASLYVQGAPTAHTNQTITNNYALWVDDGLVKFDGALTVGGTITGDVTGALTGQADTVATIAGLAPNTATTQATQPNIESIGTDGDTLSILGDILNMANTTASKPEIALINQTDDATGPIISLKKQRTDGSVQDGEDGDVCGDIHFWGYDDGTPTLQKYAGIRCQIHDATSGEESGKLTLQVANHDGGVGDGLILTGGSADNEIDVTVGLGASSLTTISGNLAVTGSIQKYSYQYITFSFRAQNIPVDCWMSPNQVGPEYYSWTNTHGSGETQGSSGAPSAVDTSATISVDYLDQTTGFIIPKACKLDGFYGNCRVNGTNPNTLRPVLALFRAAEPSDGNTSDLTATCVAFDKYDTASGNRRNRFLKLETQGLDTDLTQGDILFPAAGFDATGSDAQGDIWGSFTIVLKTLMP